MRKFSLHDISLLIIIVIMILLTTESGAQPANKDIWQEPWEGVPEYYRQWPYPDFQFPADLPEWKDKRLSVRRH
ncbi:MAG: hypothetical protein IPJ37_23275 [Bacteroidales bacterium]|nr:hypothetical protein [Bacteroidales bacterium]